MKAIAIFAVVLFHVTRGGVAAHIIENETWLRVADATAYGFHVQTFFLISGFLAFPRAGSLSVQANRLSYLYYCYLLWSLLSWGATEIMSQKVNHPLSTTDLLHIAWNPIQHFWFLLTLIGGTALLSFLRTPIALVAGIAGIYMLRLFHLPTTQFFDVSVIFILFGALVRQQNYRPPISYPLAILGFGALALLHGAMVVGGWSRLSILNPLGALCGAYATYCLASWLAGRPQASRIVSYFGRHTMSIYILHVLAGSGLRIVLTSLAPWLNGWVIVLLCLIASFAGPLIFEAVTRRLNLATAFGWQPWRFSGSRKLAASSS